MRLRSSDVSLRALGNETIVLSLPTSQYFTATGVGSRLLELLGEDVDVDDLVAAVVAEYEIDGDTARQDVEKFIGRLRDAQLLH
ncbi:PqqD family protein [Pseudonocardia sp. GCM10023141]|uniref:PqqD family protein n=1 Tax=Pseudonocardia sp. GCM10023141 TaxID=3252653 RepID=UPI00361C2A6D